MKKVILPLIVTSALFGAGLEDRVEELEMFRDMSFINFNGGLKVRHDNVTSDDHAGKEWRVRPSSLYAYFDISAKVTDRVQFYSRFAASKMMNTLIGQDARGKFTTELGASRNQLGTAVQIERAFLNYKLTDNLTFTAGRMPTIDGPPYHMYDNMPRLGTYPTLSYDSQLDGVALTYSLSEYLPFDLILRGVYTPLASYSRVVQTGDLERAVIGSQLNDTDYVSDKIEIYSLMTEFKLKKNSIWDSFSGIVQYVNLDGLEFQDVVTRGLTLDAVFKSPTFGGDGTNSAAAGNTLSFEGSTAKMTYKNLGVNLEMNKVAGTGLNVSFSFAKTTVKSSGYLESSSSLIAAKESGGSAALTSALGKMRVGHGLLTDKISDTNTGYGYLFNATYLLPFKSMTTIGGEYLKGSKYYTYFGANTDDFTNFHATRGNSYHAWVSQPLAESTMKLRLGYTQQNREWKTELAGPLVATGEKVKTIYAQLRLDF